jgi:hypothetical protein
MVNSCEDKYVIDLKQAMQRAENLFSGWIYSLDKPEHWGKKYTLQGNFKVVNFVADTAAAIKAATAIHRCALQPRLHQSSVG